MVGRNSRECRREGEALEGSDRKAESQPHMGVERQRQVVVLEFCGSEVDL